MVHAACRGHAHAQSMFVTIVGVCGGWQRIVLGRAESDDGRCILVCVVKPVIGVAVTTAYKRMILLPALACCLCIWRAQQEMGSAWAGDVNISISRTILQVGNTEMELSNVDCSWRVTDPCDNGYHG